MRHAYGLTVLLAVLTLLLVRRYPRGLGPSTQKRPD